MERVLHGCSLSMVFIVALHVPWCRRLGAMPAIKPQLYADNLKCSAVCPNALFAAARFTAERMCLQGSVSSSAF